MWLANTTRSDVASTVCTVAYFAQDPSAQHWKAVTTILEYLKGTRDVGPTFSRHGGGILATFADPTYANGNESRKSASGDAVLYGGAAVALISRIRRCVATSSSETEYISLTETAKGIMTVRQELELFCPGVKYHPIIVFEDNVGAMQRPKTSEFERDKAYRHPFPVYPGSC